MTSALLMLDFINDIVHPDGSVAGDGFYREVKKRDVLENAADALAHARQCKMPVVHFAFGYSEGFPEWHPAPKLFRQVPERKQVILGTWGTQIHDSVAPMAGEIVLAKHRINPFLGTPLATILRAKGVDTLYLAGVSTDFVILSTVLEAHDRDYQVRVLSDCVASHDQAHHDAALTIINRLADIQTKQQFTQQDNLS
ncbi:isochorismatase family cysteine hydrolase [Rhizobium sp.]|jgi:nicotinamidase-related amidase|uniref:cysteine hydrolase family protein n=1 Tax=Rhizobium sp. TaxID=391 RepID=UPI000E998AAF|nr:cysteine hydrolase [Rhizobium sp.]